MKELTQGIFCVKDFEKEDGSWTNRELIRLYLKKLKSSKADIKWIKGPKTKEWLDNESDSEQTFRWWEQKRAACEWCDSEILEQLIKKFGSLDQELTKP